MPDKCVKCGGVATLDHPLVHVGGGIFSHRYRECLTLFEDYCCGSNYCDDPACISNQPDHPDYFPHPEVL